MTDEHKLKFDYFVLELHYFANLVLRKHHSQAIEAGEILTAIELGLIPGHFRVAI